MVNVQQGSLCAFEQDILTALEQVKQQAGDIRDHGRQAFRHGQAPVQYLMEIDGIGLEIVFQRKIMIIEHFAEFGRKAFAMQQVTQSQTATRNLILVRGTDTPSGGTDGFLAACQFARLVQGNVIGQDQRAGLAEVQAFADGHATVFQHVHFLKQGLRRQHDAIPDQALDIIAQDSRWYQVQDRFLAVDYQGMPGIVTTLKPGDGCSTVGKQINHLTLALIAPVRTNYHYILAHIPTLSDSSIVRRYSVKKPKPVAIACLS